MAVAYANPYEAVPEVESSNDDERIQAEEDRRRENVQAELLEKQKVQSRQNARSANLSQELREKAVKEAERQVLRWGVRVLNFGAAATLVGIILTFLVMNTQLFLFNLAFRNSPLAKQLGLAWWEVAFIIVVDLALVVAFILMLMVVVGLSPTVFIPFISGLLWTGLKHQVCNLIPASCGPLGF